MLKITLLFFLLSFNVSAQTDSILLGNWKIINPEKGQTYYQFFNFKSDTLLNLKSTRDRNKVKNVKL